MGSVIIKSAAEVEVERIERAAESARAHRDKLLLACDWTQTMDAPLTEAERAAWADYRQALRDVPQQAGFPDATDWPEEP